MSILSRGYRKKGGKRPMSMRKRGGKRAMSMRKRGGKSAMSMKKRGGKFLPVELLLPVVEARI